MGAAWYRVGRCLQRSISEQIKLKNDPGKFPASFQDVSVAFPAPFREPLQHLSATFHGPVAASVQELSETSGTFPIIIHIRVNTLSQAVCCCR